MRIGDALYKQTFSLCKFSAEALKKNTVLQRLNLQDNNIGSRGVVELARSLRGNKSLTWLNLTRNTMDATSLSAFVDTLQGNLKFSFKSLMSSTKHRVSEIRRLWGHGRGVGGDGTGSRGRRGLRQSSGAESAHQVAGPVEQWHRTSRCCFPGQGNIRQRPSPHPEPQGTGPDSTWSWCNADLTPPGCRATSSARRA